MTTEELKDNYIYAVTRRLPKKQRGDVARELDSLISDMLEARCGGEEPTHEDLEAVVKELGAPENLALQYRPLGDRWIISPYHHWDYLFWRRTVLISVAAVGTLWCLPQFFLREGAAWEQILDQWVRWMTLGLLTGYAGVTLFYEWLSRRKTRAPEAWSIYDLPIKPPETEKSLVNCLHFTVWSLMDIVMLMILPMWSRAQPWNGEHPMYNSGVYWSHCYLLAAAAVLLLLQCVMCYRERGYTWKFYKILLVTTIGAIVLIVVFFCQPGLFMEENVQKYWSSIDSSVLGALWDGPLKHPAWLIGYLVIQLIYATRRTIQNQNS